VGEREHPVRLEVRDDLRRNRLTVFFRILLAIPHYIWLFLWSVAAVLAAIANWFATLARGEPPRALHRFLTAYVRYAAHVNAYLLLTANPYPGFTGDPRSYPVGVVLPAEPQPQRRWKTVAVGQQQQLLRRPPEASLRRWRRQPIEHGCPRLRLRVPRLVRVARPRADAKGVP
jgi:hypothetical protein